MKFRPCIDIHNGKVKQIIGGSLKDEGDFASDNYVSEKNGDYYARLYREAGLTGGHIILLNPVTSIYYEQTKAQAMLALKEWSGGLQVGGGITAENAKEFLRAGASHVIVTSYVFKDGMINYENLRRIVSTTSKKHLVLDLSCRKRNDGYYIVTNRWQTFTDVKLTEQVLEELSHYCDEFLIHAVDVEGKASGIAKELVALLAKWDGIPITYAGGVGNFNDLKKLKEIGQAKLDVTIGSALDLFGGAMKFTEVLDYIQR